MEVKTSSLDVSTEHDQEEPIDSNSLLGPSEPVKALETARSVKARLLIYALPALLLW